MKLEKEHNFLLGKKIAIDLTPILPGGENGGAKIFALDLCNKLAELLPGTQFVILTKWTSHEELSILEGRNVERFLIFGQMGHKKLLHGPLWLLVLLRKTAQYLPVRFKTLLIGLIRKFTPAELTLRKMGISLLFCPFSDPVFRESSIPTVSTIYDLQFKKYPMFFSAADREHRNNVFEAACQYADILVAISNYTREKVLEHGKVPPQKVHTIHLQISEKVKEGINAGATEKGEALKKFGLIKNSYFIYPANFWEHKNHGVLLTAFGAACKSGLPIDFKLVCTGAPNQRMLQMKLASERMGLSERVLYPGYVSRIEISELMEGSNSLIFPSLYEGFGLPIIEAMLKGIPVACSNNTSLLEIAKDASILFDARKPLQVAEAMLLLARDKNLAEELRELGRIRARQYNDLDRMARQYIEVFESLLEKNLNN